MDEIQVGVSMIKVIDNQFNLLGVIDNYTSFLAERNYYNIGKFELHLTFNEEYSEILVEENIIFITPDKPYVILYREIDTDNKMIIRGEELKNYTSRWITKPPIGQAYHRVNSNVETIMKEYVSTNCETPNLVVAPNLNRGATIVFQTRYKQLDEELEKIGLVSGIGWIVKLDLENKKFIFDIVEGLDRTEGQDINSRAIFSTDFDNVSNQTLLESKLGYKNVAIVAGQGQGVDREIQVIGNATGFDRFETFVDARDIEDTTDLPDRGLQKLSEMDKVLSFENEILTNSSLVYEEDYNVGDTVTIKNKKWNVTLDSIITSITEIYEGNNFRLSATFGNTLPTFQEVLKRKLDTPIAESGGGGEGIEVINNLESTATDKPLSANMGRELFQSVSNGKSLIAGAITDKGVDTSPSDSFNVMADNIGDISGSGELPKGLLISPLSKDIGNATSGFAITENFIITKKSSTVYVYNFEGDLLETFASMGTGTPLGIFDNKCFLTGTSDYIDLNTLQLASLDVAIRPTAVLSRYDDGIVYYTSGYSVVKAVLSLSGEIIATCDIATASPALAGVIIENENYIFVNRSLIIYKIDKSTFSIVAESNIGMIPLHSSFWGGKIYLTNNNASNNSLVVDPVTLSIITSSNTAMNYPIVSIGEQGDIFRFSPTDINQLDNTTLQLITDFAKPNVSAYYIDENKILYFISNKLFSVRNLL